MKYPKIILQSIELTELRHRVQWRINRWDDQLFDRLDGKISDRYIDIILTVFEYAHKASCSILGHLVDDDQCGIPSHRFCYFCNKSFPNGLTPNGKLTVK